MFRGSGDLYTRSLWGFVPLVELIASEPESTWMLDVPSYPTTIREIRGLGARIGAALPVAASDILITKVMLGVFGCVPALDTYFKKGFNVTTFGPSVLNRLFTYYTDRADELDALRVPTIDFATGAPTSRPYPMGKILDMIFFQRGLEMSAASNSL
jgi:hypothetical protein